MSRPIAESLSLLSETLGNCKTNLKEKEVADVDNIKISDVDEKIAEIQAGGGGADRFAHVTSFKVNTRENVGKRRGSFTFPFRGYSIELKTDDEYDSVVMIYFNNDTAILEINTIELERDTQDKTKYTGTHTGDIGPQSDFSFYTIIVLGAKRNDSDMKVLCIMSDYFEGE